MQTNPSVDPFINPEEKPLDDDPVPDTDPLAPGSSPEDERDLGKDQPVAPEEGDDR